MERKIRILLAKPGLNGHDRGIKVLARAFRDAGMEVIYLGLRQSPEMIVRAAVQEDVDVVALSILSGAHMTIFPQVLKLMGEADLAWPGAEIAVMGPKGAVEILWKRDIQSAEDLEALTEKLSQEYREKFANPYISAERGFIDDIILPRRTRPRLIEALTMLETKVDTNPRKKHGNIPL